MDYPKMLYKGVKPNAYGQLEAEQHTTVLGQDEETQARKAGWGDFKEPEPAAPKTAQTKAQAKAVKEPEPAAGA